MLRGASKDCKTHPEKKAEALVDAWAERVEEKKVETLAEKLAEVEAEALGLHRSRSRHLLTHFPRLEEKQVLKLAYTCRGGGRGGLKHTV